MTRILVCVVALAVPTIAFAQSRVATPTFSVEAGEYSTVITVIVRVSTPGATIRFTQNGLDPTESDPVITSGATLAINRSTVLKARAFVYGRRPSEVRVAEYKIVSAYAGPALGPGDAAAASAQSLLATPNGRVFHWIRDSPPQPIDGLSTIVRVAAGGSHALAVTQDGQVFSWGANNAGQVGDGTHVRRRQPVRIQGLADVVRVAAGRRHSLALTADGRVWAWGANTHGQLGLASSKPQREPAPVVSLADVVAIDAGDSHSVAITRSGEVFAWGANARAQLGDGTRSDRQYPVRVGLTGVAAIAAGASHTVAMTRDGRVYAWGSGTRGELGTGSFTDEAHPAMIAKLSAYAIRAGRSFSAAVAGDGALLMWGANDSGQLGDGTLVDRATPARGPAIDGISTLSLGARHSLAVTTSGDVWTWGRHSEPSEALSDVAGWGPPFAPDLVAPPLIQPPSGPYPAPQVITLSSADSGVTIRYTLDGSDPSIESAVYSKSFLVSANVVVRARAFSARPGAEPSDMVSASYVIDMLPPTISAEVSPAIGTGWVTGPLTVTFSCADDSGTVSCPPPADVLADGASQLISGTAVDPAGNRATASVTVSVDRTPPSVLLENSPDGTSTTDDGLLLRGRVFDSTSGLAESLRCNGVAVPVVLETFECFVALRPGVNSVALQAADVAGHVTAAGIVITRVGDAARISLAPDSRTMLINESAVLSLRDDYGVAVTDAAWSSSDTGIVALTDDEPPILTAVSAGTVTISASKNGMTAEAAIIVDAAGVMLPGVTRWTIAPTPGATMQFPLFTHRVDPEVPDMFLVETATWGEATLRAVTSDGDELWRQHSPGFPLMGDSYGGVVAGVPYEAFSADFYGAYVRLGKAAGVAPWRYESPGALMRPAQSADGTIYAIEYMLSQTSDGKQVWDKHAVVIDGRNGRLLHRRILPREVNTFTAEFDGLVVREKPRLVCTSTRRENEPSTVGPIVGGDGRGYVLVRRVIKHKFDSCLEQHARHPRTIDIGVDLLVLSPGAAPVVQQVFADACELPAFGSGSCDVAPELTQLLPDGIGGILANWDRFGGYSPNGLVTVQRVITRRTDTGMLADMQVARGTWIDTVGQAGTAYVFSADALSAVDVTSWSPKWSTARGTFGPLAAHPDGGAAIYDPFKGDMSFLTADGVSDGLPPVHLGFPYRPLQQFGSWIATLNGKLHVVAGDFPDATRFYADSGNAQLQLAIRRPGMGIYLKTQNAVGPIPIHHTAIWIAPTNQFWTAKWYEQRPDLPVKTDEFGNLMFTLGAGLPDGRDSTINCAVPGAELMVKGINRSGDMTKPTRVKTQLPIPIWNEAAAITSILAVHERYSDQAPYTCFPDSFVGFFNSNSYAHTLLEYAQVPHFAASPGWPAPGWHVLVPPVYFSPQQ
jgi:hypothetical protein